MAKKWTYFCKSFNIDDGEKVITKRINDLGNGCELVSVVPNPGGFGGDFVAFFKKEEEF